MKTVEQILEGVTAGGKWTYEQIDILAGDITPTDHNKDCAYAARACSTWPVVVKALDEAVRVLEKVQRETGFLPGEREILMTARKAVAEALKE